MHCPLVGRKPGDIDFYVVRENCEGEYSNIGGRLYEGTDQEVATLTEQLNQLPAGSGILATATLIFLVLLATDIAGYTDVFPFVKKTMN